MGSIHKAFILGAGLGTRLRPLTNYLPKPLVPIFNKPLASYALAHCQSAGINEFAINTHHLPEHWHYAYAEKSFNGSPIQFFHEPTLLDTGGGIRNINTFINDEPILIYNGDIFTRIDLNNLIERHTNSGNIATLALRSSGDNCNVNIDGDRIADMRNTLDTQPGTHQFTGIYCVQPEILNYIPDQEVSSIVPAFIQLIQEKKIGCVIADEGRWFDVGTPQAYLEIHQQLRGDGANHIDSAAIIDPTATIAKDSCVIGRGANIGAHTQLKNTVVWPNAEVSSGSIHDNAIITSPQPYSF